MLLPEVTAIQSYAGTASPFNFNGMVRHYYLRKNTWEGDIQVMLLHKNDRKASSHQLASYARELLTPEARKLGARIAVVEMPPGPPVLQTVVAEVYGPDAATRRQVASDLTGMFEAVPHVVDVDNYMAEPYQRWHFQVDTEKATRRGVSVETIARNLDMAMGAYRLGDVKRGTVKEPTYLVLQMPLEARSQLSRLAELPMPSDQGGNLPLSELGFFRRVSEDPIVYHKDLNIGVAVALEWGLIVPVIRSADENSIVGLCKRVADLADRARSKKLNPDEVQGGTFTITNPGSFGGLFGLPIINQPQVAILGVGGIQKRPVVIGDAIAIRSMMYLSMTYDHRVVDGAVADQFLARVQHTLENFDETLL